MPAAPDKPMPLYDGRRYAPSDSVGYQLFSLTVQMRREVDRRMERHGLTDAQWRPLWLLKTGRAGTAIELARGMDVGAGAVTRLLDRLEAKGLIERVRSASDRRVVHLRLTAAGETAARKIPYVLAAVNNDFLRGFSETEWKQLRLLLERMAGSGALLQSESAAA